MCWIVPLGCECRAPFWARRKHNSFSESGQSQTQFQGKEVDKKVELEKKRCVFAKYCMGTQTLIQLLKGNHQATNCSSEKCCLKEQHGSDMPHLLSHLKVCQGWVDEPIAVKTPLGWTFFGNTTKGLCEAININFLGMHKEPPFWRKGLSNFWETDSYVTKQAPSKIGLSHVHWLFYWVAW